jgi:hypothetical protein
MRFPRIGRISSRLKLRNWDAVNEVFTGFATANKGKEFVRLP